MRKRAWLILLGVAVLLALVLGIAALLPPSREPQYQGRTLTRWCEIYGNASIGSLAQREAVDAINHIGTNAIPCLLRWITDYPYPPPTQERVISWVFAHLPSSMRPQDMYRWTGTKQAHFRGGIAPSILQRLGPQAAPAIPDLERIATNPPAATHADIALQALCLMGTQAIPALERITQNTNAMLSYKARILLKAQPRTPPPPTSPLAPFPQ